MIIHIYMRLFYYFIFWIILNSSLNFFFIPPLQGYYGWVGLVVFPKESRSFGPQLFFYAYRMAINEIAPKERDFLVNEDGSKSMGQLQRREIIFLVNLKQIDKKVQKNVTRFPESIFIKSCDYLQMYFSSNSISQEFKNRINSS